MAVMVVMMVMVLVTPAGPLPLLHHCPHTPASPCGLCPGFTADRFPHQPRVRRRKAAAPLAHRVPRRRGSAPPPRPLRLLRALPRPSRRPLGSGRSAPTAPAPPGGRAQPEPRTTGLARIPPQGSAPTRARSCQAPPSHTGRTPALGPRPAAPRQRLRGRCAAGCSRASAAGDPERRDGAEEAGRREDRRGGATTAASRLGLRTFSRPPRSRILGLNNLPGRGTASGAE